MQVSTAAARLAVATSGLLRAFTISPPKVVLPADTHHQRAWVVKGMHSAGANLYAACIQQDECVLLSGFYPFIGKGIIFCLPEGHDRWHSSH